MKIGVFNPIYNIELSIQFLTEFKMLYHTVTRNSIEMSYMQ